MVLTDLEGLAELKKPVPLTKMAYDALRRSILTNQLTSDVIYNEKGLAQQLGISRTPVREALLELSSQGLVSFLPRKGVVVNKFTRKDIEEIFELRYLIELASVKKICRTWTADDLSGIEQCLEKQKQLLNQAENPITFMEIDRDFHVAISQLTGNKRLVSIIQNIRDILQLMGIRALTTRGRMEKVILEHANILGAIKKRDVEEALLQMRVHLDQSKDAVKIIKSKQ
ncbi:DNA-binding transcriptional regulator, GntR family [Desulfocicer vacuolatum DSM 3385]|uniref:DNA-binding transcriptional regulator, GntR family n=1 Tax=Desulfocicer vacuolatum DSM 3385 TaxID=1121400 RepID=A0A1W2AYS4_9BACT|nr:GntR family transcriptional regulator [Desulfocicer vacuolatum]SMC65338.1 DNA-binding transcriptional regulator, GntR family [Desulfocicer vacuolatum DSM 3385]